MSSLRLCLLLALGLSINTSIASESLEGSNAVYFQGKQSIVIAKEKDPRQRGTAIKLRNFIGIQTVSNG